VNLEFDVMFRHAYLNKSHAAMEINRLLIGVIGLAVDQLDGAVFKILRNLPD
jgi:hypothetical protein